MLEKEKALYIQSFLAPTRGFEPPTYRLGGGRSILLSYVGMSAMAIVTQKNCGVKHFFDRVKVDAETD